MMKLKSRSFLCVFVLFSACFVSTGASWRRWVWQGRSHLTRSPRSGTTWRPNSRWQQFDLHRSSVQAGYCMYVWTSATGTSWRQCEHQSDWLSRHSGTQSPRLSSVLSTHTIDANVRMLASFVLLNVLSLFWMSLNTKRSNEATECYKRHQQL